MAHSWIIRFLKHRIADKRILRLVAKWLKVGIVEDGCVTRGSCGAPQGAVISPILANVYLLTENGTPCSGPSAWPAVAPSFRSTPKSS